MGSICSLRDDKVAEEGEDLLGNWFTWLRKFAYIASSDMFVVDDLRNLDGQVHMYVSICLYFKNLDETRGIKWTQPIKQLFATLANIIRALNFCIEIILIEFAYMLSIHASKTIQLQTNTQRYRT